VKEKNPTNMNKKTDHNQSNYLSHFWDVEKDSSGRDTIIKNNDFNPRELELSKLGYPFFDREEIVQKNCMKYFNLMDNGLKIGTFTEKNKYGETVIKCKIKIVVQNIKFDPDIESSSYVRIKEIRHSTIDRPEFTSIMYNPLFFNNQYEQECVRIGLEFPVDIDFNDEYIHNDPAQLQHHIEQLRIKITHLLYDIGIRYNTRKDIWIKDEFQ
jgi:hypothetical protein